MTNFQPVVAKPPHKAVNLPDGRVVTRNGAQTVDLDAGPIAALVADDHLEVYSGGPTPVGHDPIPAPFVRDPGGASEGDVLTIVNGEPTWAAPV